MIAPDRIAANPRALIHIIHGQRLQLRATGGDRAEILRLARIEDRLECFSAVCAALAAVNEDAAARFLKRPDVIT